ncbi:MAG: SpoIIAA family protein, partial [Paludibacter sp.]
MLKLIEDLPVNVLGVTAEGKITGEDYEKVLIPALEEKLKVYKKINMLYHLGSKFSDFDLNAMLDDAKMGMKYLSAWGKIAMVSDHDMINTFAKFFGYMLSCELRIF